MIELYHMNNIIFETNLTVDIIFADYVYEDYDFSWADKYYNILKNNGIFIAMTDFHSVSELDVFMKYELGATPINHNVWKNEWGNHPKDRFHQCYDDILIYCKGNDWNFFSDKIQVPKATAKTKLNPSGRDTKTATSWIDDICLTTTSNERIKKDDGHLIRWQKPMKLMDRIFSPFVEENWLMVDPFAGSGTSGEWCKDNNVNWIGIEYDKEPYILAHERLWSCSNITNPNSLYLSRRLDG